ncbi:MAG TPA: hypothetical protein VKI41_13340 [Vicinamibacteria bacterium]|nr:hypothetical protein [Vicinamibacteria bacterium]
MGAAAIAGFVVGALYSLGYGAMLFGAVNVLATREVSMARAWLFTLRPRVLGTLLLKTIAVGFGFALCVLPGIYLGLIFSLTMPVMVEEGLFGTSAMRRSAELARYNPLRELEADPRLKVFLIVFVGMLLGYVASLVVQLPVIAIHQFMLFRDLAGGHRVDPVVMMWRLTWLQVPSTILSMLIQTAVYLYMSFGIALLFFDIKRRKEGLDLEVAIADVMASRGVVVAESAPPPSIGSPEKPQR